MPIAESQPSSEPLSVDKSATRVRRMFGQIAGRYDLANHLLSLNIDRYWRRQTVRHVPPAADGPILDLCTGTGDLALAYHRASRGQLPIVAADFCHEMLAVARRKCQQSAPLGQLRLLEADAQHLPFADGTFQIVAVAFGLRNVADTDAGLAEMVRVCRRGGRVAVLEFTTPRRQPLRSIYGWYFRNVLPGLGQRIAQNAEFAYGYLHNSVGEFPQYEALADRMQYAGLTDVRFYPLTFGVATLYVGQR